MAKHINPFKMVAVITSMDWFLYDNGLRLERVKNFAAFAQRLLK